MPIEEIPQILEFSCTLECMDSVVWNIKYDPKSAIGLHVSGNEQDIHCPVELFGDVTNFLRSKNIIKPDILTRTVSTPGITPVQSSMVTGSVLTIPQIDGQENVSPTPSGPPIDALASFDIGSPAPVEDSTAEESGIVVNASTKDEIINRPVIRTRVSKNDPKSAEKDAAAIRGTGAAGGKKAIKKRHQVEE